MSEKLDADKINAEVWEKEAPEAADPDTAAYYDVPLEEFLHYAKLNREFESRPEHGKGETAIPFWGFIKHMKDRNKNKQQEQADLQNTDKTLETGDQVDLQNANRLLRNASWMSVFYLITTDILGPTSAPYAVAQLGYAPGALLYLLLGVAAAYCGWQLYNQFIKLDSVEYPLQNFGDVVGRIYGKRVRFGVDALQALQLLCNVAVIILGNGNGLSQIAKGKGCYAVLVFCWTLIGMIVSQIKSLRRFGFLANIAIYLNVFVCIITMAIAAADGPNRTAAHTSLGVPVEGPISTSAVVNGGGKFADQLQATMNIVYAYGGAMMYIEFMAEMKRPMDFIKAMVIAESFIMIVYLLFAEITYHYQGIYTMNPAHQGLASYAWQTVCNVIHLVTAAVAACLYGNVGVKVVYNAFLRKAFKLPDLNGKYGRYIWLVIVVVYWAVAYLIASAIPQFSTLTGLVGAVCILQFTYTFPPIMQLGLDMQLSAMKADGPYDPHTRQTNRIDTWKEKKRWVRAFKDKWFMNSFHFIYFLAALTTAVLGIYASGLELQEAYGGDGDVKVVAFSCDSPVV